MQNKIGSIEEQLSLEERMVTIGIGRYKFSKDKVIQKELGHALESSQRLIKEFITPIAAELRRWIEEVTPGVNSKYRVLLREVDPEKAAYLTLRVIFDNFTMDKSLQYMASKIGTLIEDEIKFTKFEKESPEYYHTVIDDFKRKGTVNYRHMHRTLTFKAKERGIGVSSWGIKDRVAVGIKMLDLVLSCTDLITKEVTHGTKKQSNTRIKPSEKVLEWTSRFDHYAMLLNPDRMPCVIQPDEWSAIDQGGYYSPRLRAKTPMIKTKSKVNSESSISKYKDVSSIQQAVNILQNTAWRVNTDVLEVFKDVWKAGLEIGLPSSIPYPLPVSPVQGVRKRDMEGNQRKLFEEWKAEARIIHTMNKERVSKSFQVLRILRQAEEFKEYEKIWFVYQCDFRGRIYSTVSGLSPQGPDYAKALLTFSEGQVLDSRGLYWFEIHGANCYGVDKVSYKDRVKWVSDNFVSIVNVCTDPIRHKDFWANADKPWQFLAFCIEYTKLQIAMKNGQKYAVRIPIALDGTCNGIQNYSALFRDDMGAKACNLSPSDRPCDIYQQVADVCSDLLKQQPESEVKAMWMRVLEKGNLPRACAKRPVMTLPYGSTRQSCQEYIYRWIVEECDVIKQQDRFKMSVYLTPLLWKSVTQVVIKAREGMDWIQKCAGKMTRAKLPLKWESPLGFGVYQARYKIKSKQVHTQLAGSIRIRVAEETKQLDTQKQRQGAAPNFIHSLDACHLMMTLLKSHKRGLKDFACIHDDFGTHANQIDAFHEIIRESFIEMYEGTDIVKDFQDQCRMFAEENGVHIELPEPPSVGKFNLQEIKKSPYFFG